MDKDAVIGAWDEISKRRQAVKAEKQTESTMQEEYDKQVKEFYESYEEDIDNPQVNHPTHYSSFVKGLNIEAIDCMRAAFGDDAVMDFCLCNAMKYLFRHQSKGGKTDLLKCRWYIDKYLELDK